MGRPRILSVKKTSTFCSMFIERGNTCFQKTLMRGLNPANEHCKGTSYVILDAPKLNLFTSKVRLCVDLKREENREGVERCECERI